MNFAELWSPPTIDLSVKDGLNNKHPFYQLDESKYDFLNSYDELLRILYNAITLFKNAGKDEVKKFEAADQTLLFIQAFLDYGDEIQQYINKEVNDIRIDNWFFDLRASKTGEGLFRGAQILYKNNDEILIAAVFPEELLGETDGWHSFGYPKDIIADILLSVLPSELVTPLLTEYSLFDIKIARKKARDTLNDLVGSPANLKIEKVKSDKQDYKRAFKNKKELLKHCLEGADFSSLKIELYTGDKNDIKKLFREIYRDEYINKYVQTGQGREIILTNTIVHKRLYKLVKDIFD